MWIKQYAELWATSDWDSLLEMNSWLVEKLSQMFDALDRRNKHAGGMPKDTSDYN